MKPTGHLPLDMRHYRFDRTCPGFKPERKDPDRIVKIATWILAYFLLGFVVLENMGIV